jgi:hypothetical protein
MNHHAHKRATDQNTQVESNLRNVETEQIRHDEEEDTNRGKVDQHRDDAHDDDFNLLDSAHERAAWLDHITNDHGGDEDGEQAVRRKGVDNVLRNEGFEHVDDDGVDSNVFALVNGILVVCVGHFELVAADWLHEFGPDEADQQARVRDRDNGGDYVVTNSPMGRESALLRFRGVMLRFTSERACRPFLHLGSWHGDVEWP